MRFNAFAFAPLLLLSCTFTRFDVEACQTSADCRDALGPGNVCLASGFCEPATLDSRCSVIWPEDGDFSNRIIIGNLGALGRESHLARARALLLAVKDASDAGGLEGKSFAMISCDYGQNDDDIGEASELATYLRDVYGVSAIVGPMSSATVAGVYEEIGQTVLLISPSATSGALTDLEPAPSDESPGTLWRTAPTDPQQGAVIAADVLRRGVSNLGILAQSGPYGEGLSMNVVDELQGMLEPEVLIYRSAAQLSERIAEFGGSEVEEILVISSEEDELVSFVNVVARDSNFDMKRFFFADGAATRTFATAVEAAGIGDRLRGTRPTDTDTPVFTIYATRFRQEFADTDPTDVSFLAQAYDASWLALYATAWAQYNEPDLGPRSLARGLRRISSGANISIQPSNWPEVVEAFQDGASIDLSGASGPLDYSPETEELTSGAVSVWRVESGAIVTIQEGS